MTRVYRAIPRHEPHYYRRSSRNSSLHHLGHERVLQLGIPYCTDPRESSMVDKSESPTTRTNRESMQYHNTRRRVQVACGRCRKRKIRCSGDSGDGSACTNCKSAGEDTCRQCKFLRVASADVNEIMVPNQFRFDSDTSDSHAAAASAGYASYLHHPHYQPTALGYISQPRISTNSLHQRPPYPSSSHAAYAPEEFETWEPIIPIGPISDFSSSDSGYDTLRTLGPSAQNRGHSDGLFIESDTPASQPSNSMPFLNSSIATRSSSIASSNFSNFAGQDQHVSFLSSQPAGGRVLPEPRSQRRSLPMANLHLINQSPNFSTGQSMFADVGQSNISGSRSSTDQSSFSDASSSLSAISDTGNRTLTKLPTSFSSESSAEFSSTSTSTDGGSSQGTGSASGLPTPRLSTAISPNSSKGHTTSNTSAQYSYSARFRRDSTGRSTFPNEGTLASGEPYTPLYESSSRDPSGVGCASHNNEEPGRVCQTVSIGGSHE